MLLAAGLEMIAIAYWYDFDLPSYAVLSLTDYCGYWCGTMVSIILRDDLGMINYNYTTPVSNLTVVNYH